MRPKPAAPVVVPASTQQPPPDPKVFPPIPSREEFYLNTGLYERLKIHVTFAPTLRTYFFSPNKTFDCFCVSCNQNSTFKQLNPQDFSGELTAGNLRSLQNNIFTITYLCTRDEKHKMVFQLFYSSDNTIEKIGQYPSLASITKPELRKYRSVLPNEKYLELIKGVGLHSHSSGIGAFVYLRRIFEHLIEEAHVKAQSESDWDEKAYNDGRGMDSKVQMLAKYLPLFLVEHKQLYGIMSYGVHELSEELCMKFFPLILTSTELILDQKLIEKERKDKEKATGINLHELNKMLSATAKK